MPMLSVEEALLKILGCVKILDPEEVNILDSLGQVWPTTFIPILIFRLMIIRRWMVMPSSLKMSLQLV